MNNLARTYTSLGKFDQAEVLYDRALLSIAAELPEARVNLAAIHKNKASLYEQTNRYREAEDAYRAALKVQDAIYEADHPQIANSLFGLSLLQGKTARVEQAIETMQRAVNIRRKQLGPGHSKTLNAESQLARLQLLRGN
jgi:tetratricopeptide (TPR) repeat protein